MVFTFLVCLAGYSHVFRLQSFALMTNEYKYPRLLLKPPIVRASVLFLFLLLHQQNNKVIIHTMSPSPWQTYLHAGASTSTTFKKEVAQELSRIIMRSFTPCLLRGKPIYMLATVFLLHPRKKSHRSSADGYLWTLNCFLIWESDA